LNEGALGLLSNERRGWSNHCGWSYLSLPSGLE